MLVGFGFDALNRKTGNDQYGSQAFLTDRGVCPDLPIETGSCPPGDRELFNGSVTAIHVHPGQDKALFIAREELQVARPRFVGKRAHESESQPRDHNGQETLYDEDPSVVAHSVRCLLLRTGTPAGLTAIPQSLQGLPFASNRRQGYLHMPKRRHRLGRRQSTVCQLRISCTMLTEDRLFLGRNRPI